MNDPSFNQVLTLLSTLSVPTLLLIIYLWRKYKYRNTKNFSPPKPVGEGDIYDSELLKQSEEKVAKMNLRDEFAKNGLVKVDQFYSLHGYDENSMYQIIKKLQDENILSDFLFIQSMPTGTVSYMGNAGVFELYVEADKKELALKIIHQK